MSCTDANVHTSQVLKFLQMNLSKLQLESIQSTDTSADINWTAKFRVLWTHTVEQNVVSDALQVPVRAAAETCLNFRIGQHHPAPY